MLACRISTYGYVFHKVDIISILSKSALTHLLNVNIERALRLVRAILRSISQSVPPSENRADRKTRKRLLTCC
jgi:hypothetical protein